METVSERNKRCGWGQREKREKEKGKRIESSRDDRQGESAVGGRGGGQKRGLREDSYAYPLTDLNNTGDRGEGNSDVDPTTLTLLPTQGC